MQHPEPQEMDRAMSRAHADASVCVAVTAAGSGIAQAVIDGLRGCPFPVRIVGFELSARVRGLYDCDAAYRLPAPGDPRYVEKLTATCADEHVQLLIPGSDPELPVVAGAARRLEEAGCTVLTSPEACVRRLQDKMALHDLMVEHGVPFFPTQLVEDVIDRPDAIEYPAIVKPRWGSASAGIRVVASAPDWAFIRDALPNERLTHWVVQPLGKPVWWDEPTWQRVLSRRVIEQQDQLAVQLFISRDGVVVGRMAWRATLKNGVVNVVEPLDEPAIWRAVATVERAACSLGARGPINIQGIWDGERARFFEVNPRFSGSTGVRSLLGYREVEAAVRHYGRLEPATSVASLLTPPGGRIGVRQMAERSIPAAWPESFNASGRLTHPLPLARVLLTGGSGYLGQRIARTLLASDSRIELMVPVRRPVELERSFAGHPGREHLHVLGWDEMERFSSRAMADVLIHAAAVRPPAGGQGSELFVENLRLTRIAVRAAKRLEIPLVVFVSSHAVYEGETPPWSEATPVHPRTPYAFAKFACEELVRTLAEDGIRYGILRMSSLYGDSERMQWERVAHRFARQAARGEPLEVHGGGQQRIDLLHVSDAARAVICLLKGTDRAWNRTYNVSSGEPVGIMRLAEVCSRIAAEEKGLDVPIFSISSPAGTVCYGASNRLAEDELGWSPRVSLRDGLAEVMKGIWRQE